MTEIEPIADAVTGGLVGRAVEARTGVSADGHTTESNCLNCGTVLTGEYCHRCGQRGHVHRSLSAFFHDLLHGVFHFEGKIWRTLPLLASRPGELTRRYIEGQRATFVSPIALFLFSVFLMFAVLSLAGAPVMANDLTAEDLDREEQAVANTIRQLEVDRSLAQANSERFKKLTERLAEARQEREIIRGIRSNGIVTASTSKMADEIDTSFPALNDAYLKAKKNPELLLYKLKTNAYKFSWMLIPLSVPFVWLLFPFRRRFRMYDHTVFVTYSLCFMTLLAITGSLLMAAGLGSVASILWLLPPIHMYQQLRGAYALPRASALWRTVMLTIFAMIASLLFLLILVAFGIFD